MAMMEGQHPQRRAQNMAALLAIIILIGVILPIPVGAGFADWINSINAPDTVEEKYIEIDTFGMDSDALYTGSGYKPYFYWTNGSGDSLKANVTGPVAGILTAAALDTEGKWHYAFNNTDADDDADWEEGTPYWYVTFNYTAKDAYDDGVVRMQVMFADLISEDQDGDEQACTVELTAGGVTFFSKTLAATDDGDIEENVTVLTNDLRQAIINDGTLSFFRLKVMGHGSTYAGGTLDMSGCKMYCYNVGKLFGRDDGLYLVSMISVICAALGIFLVQPRYNLPFTGGARRRF